MQFMCKHYQVLSRYFLIQILYIIFYAYRIEGNICGVQILHFLWFQEAPQILILHKLAPRINFSHVLVHVVHKLNTCSTMALYKYFTPTSTSKLPDPKGPLSKEVPSSTISTINTEVKKVIEVSDTATEKKNLSSLCKTWPRRESSGR